MSGSIFRNSAVERLSTPDRLDQPLKITTSTGWIALSALAGLVVAATIAGIVIAVPVKVPGDGIIISPAGILEVPVGNAGRLTDVEVMPGQHIVKGMVVARLAQLDLKLQLDQALAEQRDLTDQRKRIAGFQEQSDGLHRSDDSQRQLDLERQVAMSQDKLKYLKEREGMLTQLFDQQLIPKEKLVDTKIEVGKSQEDIADQLRQIKEIDLRATTDHIVSERELLDLDLKLAASGRRVDALTMRLGDAQTVMSPFDGTVVELRLNAGELVQQGASLLSLLPDDDGGKAGTPGDLVAMVYVAGSEGKKIFPGMTAEVSPSTFSREEFGFMLGKVRSIAAIPATQDGMMRTLGNHQLVDTLSAGGAPFQVEIAMDRDPATPTGYRWSSSKGPNTKLTPGTLSRGQVWVRQIRLIEFVIPALRRVFHDDQ